MGSNSLPYFYAHSDTFLHQQCIWDQIPYRTFMHTRTHFYTNSAYGLKFHTDILCTLFYTNSVYQFNFFVLLGPSDLDLKTKKKNKHFLYVFFLNPLTHPPTILGNLCGIQFSKKIQFGVFLLSWPTNPPSYNFRPPTSIF